MRILVIDDDVATTELVATTLARDGHSIVVETRGTAGRDRAIGEAFDLIISDIGLPDLNGFALIRQVRAAGVDCPALAFSGYDTDEDRSMGLAAGFDSYLTKPVTPAALREEVAFQGSRPRAPRPRALPVERPAVVVHAPARPAARAAPPAPLATAPVPTPPAPPAAPAVAVTPAPARPRPRGVLGGLVVIALGVPFVLQPLGVPNAASYLFLSMGGAFLIAYLRGRQYVYLIPMVTLCSFGVALLLPTWTYLRPEAVAPAFVGIIALGFVIAFVLAPQHRWPLVPAGVLGTVAAARLITGQSPIPAALEPYLVPVVLIGVGGYLLAERRD